MDMKVNQALIKKLRLKKSWSQEKLADKAGVSLRTIQRIETDGVASLQSRIVIADVLGVEPAELEAIPTGVSNKNLGAGKYMAAGILGGIAISILLAVIWGMIGPGFPKFNQPNVEHNDARSIAVLPFKSLSPIADKDNFSAGIFEEILFNLGQIEGVRVAPRMSVSKYEKTSQDVDNIAHELSVGSVMEGSVQIEGDRVIIRVWLLLASDKSKLWSQSYTRYFAGPPDHYDAISIQSDVAIDVAKSVRATLLSGKQF